jgi:hypothetical protein
VQVRAAGLVRRGDRPIREPSRRLAVVQPGRGVPDDLGELPGEERQRPPGHRRGAVPEEVVHPGEGAPAHLEHRRRHAHVVEPAAHPDDLPALLGGHRLGAAAVLCAQDEVLHPLQPARRDRDREAGGSEARPSEEGSPFHLRGPACHSRGDPCAQIGDPDGDLLWVEEEPVVAVVAGRGPGLLPAGRPLQLLAQPALDEGLDEPPVGSEAPVGPHQEPGGGPLLALGDPMDEGEAARDQGAEPA